MKTKLIILTIATLSLGLLTACDKDDKKVPAPAVNPTEPPKPTPEPILPRALTLEEKADQMIEKTFNEQKELINLVRRLKYVWEYYDPAKDNILLGELSERKQDEIGLLGAVLEDREELVEFFMNEKMAPLELGLIGALKIGDMKRADLFANHVTYDSGTKSKTVDFEVPKYWAAYIGDLAIFKYLGIKSSSGVKIINVNIGNLRLDRESEKIFRDQITQQLQQNYVRLDFYDNYWAAYNGHLDIVKYGMAHGASPSGAFFGAGSGGHSSILDYLYTLFDKYEYLAKNKDYFASWGLLGAAQSNNIEVGEKMIEMGAKLGFGVEGSTRYGQLNFLKFMISRGATERDFGYVYTYACENKHLDIVSYMFKNASNDIPFEGDSCLYSAIKNGDINMIKYLIENGQKVTEGNINFANEAQQVEVVNYLNQALNAQQDKPSQKIQIQDNDIIIEELGQE
ncbi:MAG: ankyrin repeat domain-containing protein [Bdellovibrionales bacterium]|nr:ankyrin repeat domain-containing protein [Bdellovibrionales bacterium]